MGNSTKELVSAFNLNNYGIDKVNTNFTVEGKKIVGLFASGTNTKEYLREIGEKIIEEHYLSGAEVAGAFYNLNCFPFALGANPDKEDLGNGIVKVKLADSMDPAVIHNLKIHFANEFEGAVISKVVARLQEEVKITKKEAYEWIRGTVQTGAIGSPYLYCIAFSNEYLEKRYFPRIFELFKSLYISEFNSRLENCGLKSSDFYDNKDGMLYIKNVSHKVIKSVTEYVKGRVALDFRTPGSVESKVENCKNVLSELILEATGKFVDGYDYDDFTDEKKIKNGHSFVLIPFIEENGQLKSLRSRDASKINRVFNKEMPNGFINSNFISDIRGKTANPQFANCKEPVYAFSNKQIALLLPMIMESPIAYNQINGRFEFAVDLENFKRRGSSRSSSTVTSPFNSPTHAGPSGLETQPNPRKRNRDSDIGESPPKPKDSVAHSSSGGPSSSLTGTSTQEFPTQSHGKELEGSPRQGLLSVVPLNPLDIPGTSREFLPSTWMSSTAVSQHAQLEKCVGAAQNVPAGTSAWDQPIGAWSSPTPSAEPSLWQPSRPSSWKGANPVGTDRWSLLAPSAGLRSLPQSGPSSWKGASERRTSDKPLTKEEKEVFKAFLYWFNLNNYALDPPHTNFIVKNGKIASLIDDSVDVKEYLQKVIDKTKKGYCVNKKEAYDLNEFPFKFLSNCEKNQETTVVANISRGALLNLKELFSQEHEGKIEIKDIDINIVKKTVKSEKVKWVNLQVREHGLSPQAAVISCYPDGSALKYISIIKDEGGYWIDRNYDASEVKSFMKEQWPAKGTSVAGNVKPEDSAESGIYSEEATDAENVSSKAKATISGASGYESMDCENPPTSDQKSIGGKLLKRRSPSPWSEGESSPTKRLLRSGSSNSSSEKEVGSPRSNLSDSDSEGFCEGFRKAGIS